MANTGSSWREAFDQASRAQAEVDRRGFHLRVLYETACELSGLTQPLKILETFLLTALGAFGLGSGLAILVDTRTRRGHIAHRGLAGPVAEACERNLAAIAGHYLPEGQLFPHAEIIRSGQTPDPGLLPADNVLSIRRMVDENYAVLAAFGGRLTGQPLDDTEVTTLLNLAGTMADALAHNLFDRRFQHLSAGLARQSAELEEALNQAGQARANLDRRIFHLQTLYECTAELSPVVATEKLLEAFLLMVMGAFGTGQGTLLLCDRKSRRVYEVGRGVASGCQSSFEEAEQYLYRRFQATPDRRLAPMSVSFVTDPRAVFAATEIHAAVHTAAIFTVDDTLLGLLALGVPLGKADVNDEERELLRGLTANFMVFLKNARAFETIQALNADLSRTNADLRRTIAELTEARDQIRLLELAKSRLKQFIRGEIERAGRLRLSHVLLILLTSALLALAFNYSSPNGIPILSGIGLQAQSVPVDALELQLMMSRGEAVLVDARPPELFSRKHIAGAINIPAPLFDIIFPMKLGSGLKPEQVVAVYGSTLSKRYDAELIERLLQRHERVMILAGGLSEWEAKGFPVAP